MNVKNCLRLTLALSLLISVFPTPARADDPPSEDQQITVLQSTSSPREKDAACAWLKRHGTARSVPALAALLTDEQLSHSARYALESLPGPEAENALLGALTQTNGLLKAGVINSLGVRRDPQAVSELAPLLADPDASVARASATALGDISSPDALKALEDRLNSSDSSTHNAVVDGCLHCAQQALAAGNREQAFSVYQEIYQAPAREFLHVAAWRGMVLAAGSQQMDLLAQAITNGPAPIQMEAIQLVHEKAGPGATEALVMLLPQADPLVQVALIDALGQRDDPAAAPEIASIAKQAAPETRVAAVASLGNLGDNQDIPLLIDIAATADDPAQAAARQALVLIHRGTPNQALLDSLSGAPAGAQVEIIRALNERTATEAIPQLLGLARQAEDPVRQTAFQALARLVDQGQLGDLVQIVGQMATDTGRASAAHALSLACRHIEMQHGTVDLTPVLAALKNGTTETRVALLPVCSGVADEQVRAVLRASLTDSDASVQAAAVRALCNTMDAALVPDVVTLAVDSSNDEVRALAIESVVRLTTQEPTITIPDPERVKFFQAIMPVAGTTAEKRLALSGLAALPDAGALTLAEPLLADGAVSNEAALAVIGICRHLPDATAKPALENLVPRVGDDQIRQEAQMALKMVIGRADYITTWQIAGPYRKAGQDYSGLFDIVFPPETAGAPGVKWRLMPVNDDPESPWSMDLLKAIGGLQVVAYARASIHSDGEQSAWLVIHSDDGVKAWLNGEVVDANNTQRAVTSPPDKVKITLKPGWNHLVLKVTQNNAGWGFAVRLTNPDGSPLTGLHYAAGPMGD